MKLILGFCFLLLSQTVIHAADTASIQIRDISPIELKAVVHDADSAFLYIDADYLQSDIYLKISGSDSLAFSLYKDTLQMDSLGFIHDSVEIKFNPQSDRVFNALLTITTAEHENEFYQISGDATGTVTVQSIKLDKKIKGLSYLHGVMRLELPVPTSVELFDMNGRCVRNVNSEDYSIEISGIIPGVYVLRLNKDMYKILLR